MKQRIKKLYSVLVLDPPWLHGDSLGKRGAKSKYTCMPIEKIKQFELPAHSKDCVLFLWRVAGMIEEAYEVARCWGFNPTKGEVIWRKLTPTGKEHFGMGYIVRWAHEGCIIASKGKVELAEFMTIQDYEACVIATKGKPKVLNRSTRSMFSAPVPRDENGEIIHSAKPDEFFHIVKSLYPGPRASVFERKLRPGFDCYGDEMRYENDSRLCTGADSRSDRVPNTDEVGVSSRRERRNHDSALVIG